MKNPAPRAAIINPLEIYSERLVLRPVNDSLRSFVFEGLSDHEVRYNMQMPTLDSPIIQNDWWRRFSEWRSTGKAVQWCAFCSETDEYIGLATIKEIEARHRRGEIGYSLLKKHWRKGYGREMAARVLQYAFEEIDLHTVFAIVSPLNEGSQKIVKSLGLVQEGCFRDSHFFEGKYYDLLQFSVINPRHKK